MKKQGSIYLIKNNKTNKIYIGQTTRSPFDRWKEHLKCINKNNSNKLYKDIKKYGIVNYSFQILEINIPLEQLDRKEKYYIEKYQSNNEKYGYNITIGGKKETITKKLNETEVNEIINLIKKGVLFNEIAQIYNVNPSTISDINNGDTWFLLKENYPINQTIYKHKNFNNQEIERIYNLLKEKESITNIAKYYNVSKTTISKINKGLIYHNDKINYPVMIYQNNGPIVDNKKLYKIASCLSNTSKNIVQIARKLHIERTTISGINNGYIYKEELKKLGFTDFPIKKTL